MVKIELTIIDLIFTMVHVHQESQCGFATANNHVSKISFTVVPRFTLVKKEREHAL